MRNQYPGTCYRCNKRVNAGDGHFERNYQGGAKWRLQHAGCAIQHRGTDVGKEGATELRQAWQLRKLKERAAGTGRPAQRARAALDALGFEIREKGQ